MLDAVPRTIADKDAIFAHAGDLHCLLMAAEPSDATQLVAAANLCVRNIRRCIPCPTPEDDEALEAIVNAFDTTEWFAERLGHALPHPLVQESLANANDILEAAVLVLTRWRSGDPPMARR
jgi:hypothetical protein